jgi:excisionase family DNA binding protein
MKERLNDYLTVKELSAWVKLSESHIYFLVNKRKIPFSKIGGKLLFDSGKIKDWIDNSSVQDEPELPKGEKKKRTYTKRKNVQQHEPEIVKEPEPIKPETNPKPEPIQEPKPDNLAFTNPAPVEQNVQEPLVENNQEEDILNSPLD